MGEAWERGYTYDVCIDRVGDSVYSYIAHSQLFHGPNPRTQAVHSAEGDWSVCELLNRDISSIRAMTGDVLSCKHKSGMKCVCSCENTARWAGHENGSYLSASLLTGKWKTAWLFATIYCCVPKSLQRETLQRRIVVPKSLQRETLQKIHALWLFGNWEMEETHCNISMMVGSDAPDHSTCAELQSMRQREQTRKGTVDDVRIAEVSLAGRGYRSFWAQQVNPLNLIVHFWLHLVLF